MEILDESGRPLPPGERGEIVVTGGINPFLPLVRYRTGDFAAISLRHEVPRLIGIERRRPVIFRGAHGATVPSISVTVALFHVPLPFFSLFQASDGSFTFRPRCDQSSEEKARRALEEVFGAVPLKLEQVPRSRSRSALLSAISRTISVSLASSQPDAGASEMSAKCPSASRQNRNFGPWTLDLKRLAGGLAAGIRTQHFQPQRLAGERVERLA